MSEQDPFAKDNPRSTTHTIAPNNSYVRGTSYCNILFVSFTQVILGAICLGVSEDDCNEPVYLWLTVYVAVTGILTLIQINIDYAVSKKIITSSWIIGLFLGIIIIGGIFSFVWLIIGSVWVFGDDSCKDDEPFLWGLSLAILICFYLGITVACCLCCFAICGVGALAAAASSAEADLEAEQTGGDEPLIQASISYGATDEKQGEGADDES